MNISPLSKNVMRRALKNIPGGTISCRRQRVIRKRVIRGLDLVLERFRSSRWINEVRESGVKRLLSRAGTSSSSFFIALALHLHFDWKEIGGESACVHFGLELELKNRGRAKEYDFLESLWLASANLYEAHFTSPAS